MKRLFWMVAALGCARVELEDPADGGLAYPRIADVQPAPGPVQAGARFEVKFSAAMDEGPLLASSGRSETVVLAPEAVVERAAAAIEHSRLSTEERSLLVPAQAAIATGSSSLSLAPDQPLAPGSYWLLASTRLKDARGRHLQGGGRFRYTVAAAAPRPTLLTPPPGATVAANLARVRVAVPADGGTLTIAGPGGPVAAAPAVKGVVELPLCPAWVGTGCSALRAGQTYSLALDGESVAGASFTAAQCPRLDPPRVTAQIRPRDTSIAAEVRLDWPARVSLQVGACPGCAVAEAFASCAPDPCNPPADARCSTLVRVEGLTEGTLYDVRLAVEDDEGHLVRGAPRQVVTTGVLPRLLLSEIMASPPPPVPRSDGEYVEIRNAGSAPADVSTLALEGVDGIARPVAAAASDVVLLPPGGRALAVGAAFDPSRYSLPAGVPVLRAATQRLLGRGLADDPPPRIALLAPGADGGMVELDRFPGGSPHCPEGASIEAAPDAGWSCGADGGSPGRPP